MLSRNNPKVYLTSNHGDCCIVNPRTNLGGQSTGGWGAFLITIMDPIFVDKKTHTWKSGEIWSILGMENQKYQLSNYKNFRAVK